VGEEEQQYRLLFVFFKEFYLGHEVENNKTGWGRVGRCRLCSTVIPFQAWTDPLGLQELVNPENSRQSANEDDKFDGRKHRPPLPPGNIPGTHFCYRLSRPQGHCAVGRIVIWNRTR